MHTIRWKAAPKGNDIWGKAIKADIEKLIKLDEGKEKGTGMPVPFFCFCPMGRLRDSLVCPKPIGELSNSLPQRSGFMPQLSRQ